MEVFEKISSDVCNENSLRLLLEELRSANQHQSILNLSDSILEELPDSSVALGYRGIALYEEKHSEEAILALEKALVINPDDDFIRSFAASTNWSLGTHAGLARARDHLRLLTQRQPEVMNNYFALGRLCTFVGPVKDGVAAFRHYLTLAPENAQTHYFLSEALSELGEYDEAKIHLTRSLELGYQPSHSPEVDMKAINLTPKAKKKIIRSRYPDTEDMKSDFIGVIKKTVISDLDDLPAFITPETRFFTLGSCFARHMARALNEAGHECYHIEVGDVINTTYANRAIMEWIAGTLDPALEQRMNEVVGALTTKENFVEQIRKADVFIFTMGVAACFFERGTGRFVMPRPTSINSRALAETYDFRTTRVSENVANMKFIIDAMRAINPALKIFITVSPVPLHVTFERNASVVGDCLSKSVMRVSADELMHAGYDDIHYWPSFEIVRWLSGHVGPFFGVDDGASWHISETLIEQIIGLSLQRFTPPEQLAA
jgi:tetratricopeptide (TPR) repeat protein